MQRDRISVLVKIKGKTMMGFEEGTDILLPLKQRLAT